MTAQTEPAQAFEPLAISLVRSSEQHRRWATRLLTMIHELHKAGYQRLRIVSGMSPSGMHWRFDVLSDANVRENGWEPNGADWGNLEQLGLMARYTTGQGSTFFGWTDAQSDNARQLAAKFLDASPISRGRGGGGLCIRGLVRLGVGEC